MMKSKLTIDARWLIGGIGTYTLRLLEGLSRQGNGFEVHAITRQNHAELLKQWCSSVTVVDVPIYTLREHWAIPRAARGSDLLHIPHYNAPLLSRGPMVASILDLIHITDPEYRSSIKSWAYARPMLNLVARKAEHIVTISEYSKAQIVDRLGISPSKITAIYCGVDPQFGNMDRHEASVAVSKALGIQQPYLLYVGNLKPHKNISTLLRAYALLRERHDIPQQLLIVGDDLRWGPARREECSQLGIVNATHFVPHVTQELLPKVYAAADLLVMPSTIEGFGLPVLEAMAGGTPVVCSHAASLPEVGGDAVLYFDPKSPEELASAIDRVLSSPELQDSLRAKGLERAKQFTWEDSTRKHLELYRSLVG